MKIKVFAILKEYFSETFEVPEFDDCVSLQNYLTTLNPEAHAVLAHCRFAQQGKFVSLDTKFLSNDTIYIMPPSSGG